MFKCQVRTMIRWCDYIKGSVLGYRVSLKSCVMQSPMYIQWTNNNVEAIGFQCSASWFA